MEPELVSLSKFLSLILRHKPEKIGLKLNEEGWADVEELIEKASAAGKTLTIEKIAAVVAQNDKQRFSYNKDLGKIRANQGHSIAVRLELPAVVPPEILYHGTAEKNLPSIFQQGIQKQRRQYVHLSADTQTARKVGMRYGKPVVLEIRAGALQQAGHTFFRSENGVWLTDEVPVAFISVYKGSSR